MADLQKPTVVVLTGEESGMGRPPGMSEAEALANVRYVRSDELPAALPDADALFVWDFLSTAVAGAWPAEHGPRWVHIASAGVDRLLFPELVSGQAVVTNSRGVFEEPIADYVLLLVLAFARDLTTTLRHQSQRRWQHRETERVAGARALVIGTGRPPNRKGARIARPSGPVTSRPHSTPLARRADC